MNKLFAILISILLIGACATPDACAQKRARKSQKKVTTTKNETSKTNTTKAATNAFPTGTWQTDIAVGNQQPAALEITFDASNNTFKGKLFDETSRNMKGTVVTLTCKINASGTYKIANNKMAFTAGDKNCSAIGTCKFSDYNNFGRDKETMMTNNANKQAQALLPYVKQFFNGSYRISNITETSFVLEIDGQQKTFVNTKKQKETANNKVVSDDGNTFIVNGVSFKMIPVEGGSFTMGAASNDPDADWWEKPAHKMTVSSFSIGEIPVTQELWQAVMGSNPSKFISKKLPVESVTWNDCQEFIKKLNKLTGKKFRLPTSAEWEYAARGGNKSKGYKYAGSNNAEDVAWFSCGSTRPVATKKPNELGLYDMSGNVWEWTSERYANYDGSYSSYSDTYVYRGGSWTYGASDCRVSNLGSYRPYEKGNNIGLRLAL